MLRETVKAGIFCDFSSFSSCGKDWGVGGMVDGEGTTPPFGHPSRGGEFTLAGLGGEFMLDCMRGALLQILAEPSTRLAVVFIFLFRHLDLKVSRA
jgi:hypothetical protein